MSWFHGMLAGFGFFLLSIFGGSPPPVTPPQPVQQAQTTSSSSQAAIIFPKPRETVGPNFSIVVVAPDVWFKNGATTVIVTEDNGTILMTGGATVNTISTATSNGLTESKIMIDLMGPGDEAGPYAGPVTIMIEPQLQNVLTQVGDIKATSDLQTRLKNNTVRSPQELQIPLILKAAP